MVFPLELEGNIINQDVKLQGQFITIDGSQSSAFIDLNPSWKTEYKDRSNYWQEYRYLDPREMGDSNLAQPTKKTPLVHSKDREMDKNKRPRIV